MTDQDKIKLMDYIINSLNEMATSKDMPIMVGTLQKAQGFLGFKLAEIGHPVFEFEDRYLIYIESKDGKTTVSIRYRKETLSPVIDFM